MIVPNIPHIPVVIPAPIMIKSHDFSTQDVTFIGITVLLFTIMFCSCMYLEYHHNTFSDRGILVPILTATLIFVLSIVIGYLITYLIF